MKEIYTSSFVMEKIHLSFIVGKNYLKYVLKIYEIFKVMSDI